MNHTPQARDGVLVRLQTTANNRLRSVRQHWERRRLEVKLANLIEAARGHEAQGLAPGSQVYVLLRDRAEVLVNACCDRWRVSPDQLKAEIPALGRLRRLASPREPRTWAIKSALALLVVMLSAYLLGIAGALARLGYHLFGGGQ